MIRKNELKYGRLFHLLFRYELNLEIYLFDSSGEGTDFVVVSRFWPFKFSGALVLFPPVDYTTCGEAHGDETQGGDEDGTQVIILGQHFFFAHKKSLILSLSGAEPLNYRQRVEDFTAVMKSQRQLRWFCRKCSFVNRGFNLRIHLVLH